MKIFKLSFSILLVFILTQIAFSQRLLDGKVVEVIDGKTVVVKIQRSGNLTVVLQFIEIPEPEQPLRATIKEHLEKLLLGKDVKVLPQAITSAKSLGQIFLDGVDVSQQMLRDGAAWYAVPEKSGQNSADSASYHSNEAQAKNEKRGVWSIENLKPAWEFRAEKEAILRAEERAALEALQAKAAAEKPKPKPKPPLSKSFISSANFASTWESADMLGQMWEDKNVFGSLGVPNADGLVINTNAEYNAKLIMTTPLFLEMKAGKEARSLQSGFGYFTFREPGGTQREGFGMAMKSVSEAATFNEKNDLTFVVDGKKMKVGKAIPLGRQSDKSFEEMLIYTLNRDVMASVATSEKVQINVGVYSVEMPAKLHTMIKKLIIESTK